MGPQPQKYTHFWALECLGSLFCSLCGGWLCNCPHL